MQNIDAVIVTYNRKEKLRHAIECYERQIVPFRNLIVVDNCSTDGTIDLLKEWEKQDSPFGKYVLYLMENRGGSGGFYEGERFALTLSPDWIYISDDDAYPSEDIVKRFNVFYELHKDETIAGIGSLVLDMTGNIMYSCRGHFEVKNRRFRIKESTEFDYREPYFSCDSLSYVGVFLSSMALKKVGLVNKDFFIYQDDVEHSLRLRGYGAMYCYPSISVVHDSYPVTQTRQEDLKVSLWKEYYAVRNRVYMLLHHFPIVGVNYIIDLLDGLHVRRESSMSVVNKMALEGVKDACIGRLGVHSVYRPGVVLEDNRELPYPKVLWNMVYFLLRIRKFILKTIR